MQPEAKVNLGRGKQECQHHRLQIRIPCATVQLLTPQSLFLVVAAYPAIVSVFRIKVAYSRIALIFGVADTYAGILYSVFWAEDFNPLYSGIQALMPRSSLPLSQHLEFSNVLPILYLGGGGLVVQSLPQPQRWSTPGKAARQPKCVKAQRTLQL